MRGKLFFYLRQRGYFFPPVSVNLSVNRVTQKLKLLNKAWWNFMEWLDITQGQVD